MVKGYCQAPGERNFEAFLKKKILVFALFSIVSTLSAQTRFIDSLKQIVALQKHDTVELEALLNLSNEFLRKDLSLAKLYSKKVIPLADTPLEAKWLSGAYNYLITIYHQSGRLDSAHYVVELSEKLINQNPGNIKMRYNFNQAVGLFYKNRGEFKQALPYMLDNLKIWTKQDENRAGLMLNLGNLYFSLGDYKKSTDYHLQALRLFEKLNNVRGQSFCLHSLGGDFFNLNQLQTAQKYYERSLQLKEQLGDKRGVLNSTVGLGDVYKDLNDYPKSEAYYQKALTAARSLKFPSEEARALHQSGLLYSRMRETEKARNSFTQSMALSKQLGDSVSYVKTNSELINLDLAEQKNRKVESQMLDGLNTLIRTGDRQQEAIEYSRLSEYYSQNKDFEKALFYLKKHEALTDSVEGNTVLIQLKELEGKYESEKKEREIELLKKDQEVQALTLGRQRANIIIITITLISVIVFGALLINRYRVVNRIKRQVEIERVRNNIARDLHDDIGSTLSSINIMSQVASNENGVAAAQLQKIASHSSRMMESMSDIVWSINPKNDSLEQVVVKMKEFAAEMLEPKDIAYDFQVSSDILSMTLDVEKRKNIFLVFKEGINNAAKYSEGKRVLVMISQDGGSFKLEIRDDGKGFSINTNGTGNGLRNMEARAQAMGGKLEKVSILGTGTTISLQLPIT